jgi:hypothetical protein
MKYTVFVIKKEGFPIKDWVDTKAVVKYLIDPTVLTVIRVVNGQIAQLIDESIDDIVWMDIKENF